MAKTGLGIHSHMAFIDGKNDCTNWILLAESISRSEILIEGKKSDPSCIKTSCNYQWMEKCSCWQS